MQYCTKHCQCKHSFRGQKESTLVFATSRAKGNTTTTVAGIFLGNTLLKPNGCFTQSIVSFVGAGDQAQLCTAQK